MTAYQDLFSAFVERCIENGRSREIDTVIRAAQRGKSRQARVQIMVAGARAKVASPAFPLDHAGKVSRTSLA